ncbi:LSM12 homolog a [Carabus blaptoides fortunei]
MLILKCPSTNGQIGLNDVHIVNLSLVSDVQVKKEVTTIPEPPQSLNLQRLNTRVRNHVEEKRRLMSALSAGVGPEGQRLFIAIAKTINEVQWCGSNIVVWNQKVVISPPYQVEDIKGNTQSKEYGYIRKVVEKHMKDNAANNTSPPSSVSSPLTPPQHAANAAAATQ